MRELVRALVRRSDAPALRLFDAGPGPAAVDEAALGLPRPSARVKRLKIRIPRRALEWFQRGTGVGADRLLGRVQLFHRAFHDQPAVRDARQVLPLFELPRPGSEAEAGLHSSLERIGDVIVAGPHAADVVRRRYDLDSARVHVVPVGCEHWTRSLDSAPARHARDEPALLVCLGRTDASRRPLEVLAAFERLRERGVPARLRFAGRPGDAANELAEAARSSRRAADVSALPAAEAELPGLVSGASVLVHIAEEAWTPVTPLEALAAGVAVVATRLPTLEEVLAGQAAWVDLDAGPPELAEAMQAALAASGDPSASAERRALAGRYTWDRCAGLTAEVWQRILARP